MTDSRIAVSRKIVELKKLFAHHSTFAQVQELFLRLIEKRRVELEEGVTAEARGIALIGSSGSGKTTAISRLLSHTPGLLLDDPETGYADVVSFQVPSPATLKFVGVTALEALGYPLKRERTAMLIWGRVREHLRMRRTLFLHLDEAQDILRHQSPKELQSVVRTLKSLMQNKDWPVGLILSGMPELKELLNHDPQLARRFFPVEFPRLHPDADSDRICAMAKSYAERTGSLSFEPDNSVFSQRLMHAADCEFGLSIELVISAIEEALLEGGEQLQLTHFAKAFARRSGCVDGLNPFLADDFLHIDARELLHKRQMP